jgi:hypothetical protein
MREWARTYAGQSERGSAARCPVADEPAAGVDGRAAVGGRGGGEELEQPAGG